jgi:demethylmenaquinone methyltransferase/2-methoxy-6-polyprenyl-1,4-benzoquinol methylase
MITIGDGALPTGPAKTTHVREMFDVIAPRYDLVNRVMTLGLDQGWRRTAVGALGLPSGSLVLDLACGTGDLGSLARRMGHRTIGFDLSRGMLAAAGAAASPAVQGDVVHLSFADATFDGVVCGYALRNFTDLDASLRETARVVRPGGRLALLEVASPESGLMRAGFRLWFERIVPVLGGALSDPAAYRYLPRSMAYLPDRAELRAILVGAGFSTIGHRLLHGGLSQLITATRVGLPLGAARGDARTAPAGIGPNGKTGSEVGR